MMHRTTPLHRYLSMRFGLVAVLPFLVIIGLVWKILLPQLSGNTAIQHESAAQAIAGQVAIYLDGGERQLLALSNFISAETGQEDQWLEQLLDTQCGKGDLFETIYITDRRDQIIIKAGLAQENRSKKEDILGLDLSGRHFIFSEAEAGKPVWSETFLSTVSGRMAVALSIPTETQAIIGEISLDRLSEIISRLPVQGEFITLVLDRNGRIIADSMRQSWGRQLDLASLFEKGESHGNPFSSVPFVLNGTRMLGTLVQVHPLEWQVLVAQPEQTAYKPLTAMFAMLASGLGIALALALVTAWLQAGSITRHIRLFTRQARKISQGEYDMELPSSRTEELTALGQNLIRMADLISQREAALMESEMRLAITLDSIGDAVIATDTAGRVTRMNPMAETLTGWPKEEAAGHPLNEVFDIVNALTGETVASPADKVMATGKIVGLANHTLLKARDGQAYQISDSGAPIRKADGSIVGVVLVFRDVTEIYTKEQQIRENEKLLKNITENIPEAVFQFEFDSTANYYVSYISPRARDIFGIPARPATFISDFIDHLPMADQAGFKASILKAVRDARTWTYEGGFVTPSGRMVWFSGSAGVQQTPEKTILNGVLTDLTQRHEMEKVLRITQFSFDHAAIGIFHLSQDGRIEMINPKGADQLGYNTGELTGQHLSFIDPMVDPDTWQQIRKDLLGTQDMVQMERIHRKKTGEDLPVLITTNQLEYDGDSFSIAFAQDITQQKKAQAELDRLNTYLANVFDSMPSALIGVDTDQCITQWNKSVAELTGISLGEAVGNPVGEVFPRLAAQAEKIMKSLVTGQVSQSLKAAYETGRGETRYEDITIYPLAGRGGDGAVIRIDDITEKVRIEETLIQNEKMLSVGGLAAGMAHEINNPLAGVIQNANLLVNRLGSPDMPANVRAAENAGITMDAVVRFMADRGVPRMLKAISDSGLRMAAIVENMLSFARKGDSTFSSHDPAGLMDKVLELAATDYDLKKHYDFKSIEIKKEYEANLPMIACEGSKIQQVLLNVLSNGAYAMFERKECGDTASPRFVLRLSTSPGKEMLHIEIEDNGGGMDEATRKKVFEPFFTTKPTGVGTGLGLSVSYFIIKENHGGDMEVVSEPGRGTRFIISLPFDKSTG